MGTLRYPTRAMAVANWFIKKSLDDPGKPACDQMKLYKLVFYAHGWYMGNCHAELFPEDVEAWPHGPVIRDLYVEFRTVGKNPITRLGKRIDIKDGKTTFVHPEHDGSLNDFFERIWDVYGDYTGIQLSNMTHRPGEAWTMVAEQYGYDLSAKPLIPPEIIEAAFERKVPKPTA